MNTSNSKTIHQCSSSEVQEQQQAKRRQSLAYRFLRGTSRLSSITAKSSNLATSPSAGESEASWSARKKTKSPKFKKSPKKLFVTKTSIVQHHHSRFLTKETDKNKPAVPLKPLNNAESIECIFSTMAVNQKGDSSPRNNVHEPSSIDPTGHWELHSYPSSDSEEEASEQTAITSTTQKKESSQKIIMKPNRFGSFFYVACFGRGANVYEDEQQPSSPPTHKMTKFTTRLHVADIVGEHPRDYSTFLKAYDELLMRSHQFIGEQQKSSPVALPNSFQQHVTDYNNQDTIIASRFESSSSLPDPSLWPQFPLALRATPNTGMKILGVRYSSSSTYFPEPWCSALPKNNSNRSVQQRMFPTKEQLLPINSGFESSGESLVIDFETELFIGTLMMRIKDAFNLVSNNKTNSCNKSSDKKNDYFGSMNRKYQAVIRGEFKTSIPIVQTVTGQAFPSPVLNLPSKWVLKSAVSVISVFAPQLQANFDGGALKNINGPSFISPLGSTPQVVIVQEPGHGSHDFLHRRHADQSLESSMEEPTHEQNSLVGQYHIQKKSSKQLEASPHSQSSIQRANIRKKAFDKLFAKSDESVLFTTGKIYTFEFLQHLVNFKNFTLDLSLGGSIDLCHTLNGQPLRAMGAHLKMAGIEDDSSRKGNTNSIGDLKYLWSFDVWHQGLYKDCVSNSSTNKRNATSTP